MGQISYGTITITDTNDIERIYMVYAGSSSDTAAPDASNFNLWKADITQVSGDYIWQRTVVKKSGITITSSNFQEYYGDPVCITGPEGAAGEPARKITKVTPYYYLSTSSSSQTGGSWSDTPAAYPDTGTYYYWTKTVTTYDSGSPTESTPVLDKALNSANKAARDANQTASTTQTNLNNYITSNDAALDALQTKTKYFWSNFKARTKGNDGWTKPNYPVGTYAASGIDNVTFDTEDSSTYGYNTLYANGINLRYNAINLGQLTGSSLIFYNPSTTSQGTKAMELSGSALKFYASDGATAQAEFGGTKARVSGTIQALDGQIGNNSSNYWYIGNYIDYNQNQSAAIKSHGTAFIQLGDNNTWRLATNRFHSAWNDDSSGTAGQLHYPIYDSKYWDSGLHLPTSSTDKFLYIRNAPNTQSLENLQNDLEDSGYNYWTYQFYIDGAGNLHAGDIYSHDTLISGASAPYLLKSGGTMTGSITMSNGGKFIGNLTGNADTASNASKVNGLTVQTAVPANALFTDKNVQTSQANTTKLYLVGTSTTATNTGTLNFDSNIYADTTAGALHATTFNGYTLAAASAKGVDTSMPTTAADSNVPTTKLMKSFVEGKGYITSETDPVFKASAAYGISSADISNWNSKTSNTGTVTSVRVQASSPLTSTTSTASSTTLDTTIKFANQNKNLVLAGPSSGNAAAPTFRSLVADDIPGLAWSKITSGTPTTLSGYGITDAAGLNALVGLSASSNSAGVTTFTATRASGTNPLSFEVSIVASAAAGANALRDSEGPISKGSVTKPVYFNNGVPAEANTYAGGTAVTLNNASKASSTASFYAPTSGGTTSQVLVGNGTTSAPTWKAISDIVPSKASTADAFSSAAEVKLTGDTTGSASSTKGWSITTKTDRISTVGDNRAVATTPNDYVNKMIFQGLKTNSSFDSPSTDTYSYVVGLRGWSDSSGGNSHEFAFNNSGINHRSGATTSWGAWEKLVTSNNYTDYTVTKTGSGASGTWGISISGTAAKATNDSDGNAINTTYLKKSGGTMTGVLNALANQYTDSYSGALNMNNSNIYGVNSIYTADLSDNSQEGIHFYRTSTTVDTIYAKNGDLYFVPNRTLGSNGTSYTVLHTGNYTSTLNNKYVTIDTDQTITASQKTFNGATRWGTASKYGAVHYDSSLDAIVFSFA